MPFCEYCGVNQSGTAKFCRKCGKQVKATDVNTSGPVSNSGMTENESLDCAPPDIHPIEFRGVDAPTSPVARQPRQSPQKSHKKENEKSFKKPVWIILFIVLGAVLLIGGWQYYNASGPKDGSMQGKQAVINNNAAINNLQTSIIKEIPGPVKQLPAKETPAFAKQLPSNVRQAIVVQDRQNGFSTQLELWSKDNDFWQKIHEYTAVIGQNGFAPSGEKREGDNRTPSGTYNLGQAFGYFSSSDTKMPYRQLTENDYWVDDPSSSQYNTWVYGVPSARSYERLKRSDSMHKYGIVITYNTNPVVSGNGSAIFLHVWRSAGTGTAGGIALAEDDLVQVLRSLDPAKDPRIILNYKE